MQHVTLEFDGAGTFIGSITCTHRRVRSARFGLLYLHDGVATDGRRILPEGGVAYSRRSTLGSSYGAGFWTNDGNSEFAAERVASGFPKDGFFASGNLGQRIYIVPSERLVIVRFGYSRDPSFGIGADLDLIAAAIARSSPQPDCPDRIQQQCRRDHDGESEPVAAGGGGVDQPGVRQAGSQWHHGSARNDPGLLRVVSTAAHPQHRDRNQDTTNADRFEDRQVLERARERQQRDGSAMPMTATCGVWKRVCASASACGRKPSRPNANSARGVESTLALM